FEPQSATLSARQKWLASGSVITGRIVLDKGAVKAIQNRKSLLSVGVLEYIGDFEKGEVVEMLDLQHNPIAVARARYSKSELINTSESREVANADDIVVY
ncbi:MAG: PUA domain-containing protein, partial [Aquirufa sp.]